MAQIQGRDDRGLTEQGKSDMSIHYQNHLADPVGTLIGWNSTTGGTVKNDSTWEVVKEAGRALGGKNTSHNCYGDAPSDCKPFWQDQGGKASWEPVYKPKISKSINSNDKKGE